MLKAIWPSLRVRVPNQLPESANITTLGRPSCAELFRSSQRLTKTSRHRDHVLLHLLGDSIPIHARLSAKDPVAVPRQSGYRPTLLACLAHLGIRQSPFVRGSFHSTRNRNWERPFLGVFGGAKRLARVIRDLGREYPRFYGRIVRPALPGFLWTLIGDR